MTHVEMISAHHLQHIAIAMLIFSKFGKVMHTAMVQS